MKCCGMLFSSWLLHMFYGECTVTSGKDISKALKESTVEMRCGLFCAVFSSLDVYVKMLATGDFSKSGS